LLHEIRDNDERERLRLDGRPLKCRKIQHDFSP
jgi:hypothetical protein